MRTRLTAIVLAAAVLLTGLIPFPAAAQTTPAPATSSLIVKVVAGLTTDQHTALVGRNGGTITSSIPALRLLVVSVPETELAATLTRYQADPQVQNVEENKIRVSEAIPSDALYGNQWALVQIGWDQVFGVVNPTGSAKVALLDTGVDASHPELAGKVVAGTSILDGSDGLTDPSGHGTWLAGIIAARTNNGLEGIAGVAYAGVQVMPVTVLNANGEGQDSDVIAGVIWAADHGADVILMAFSNPGFSPNLQDAIDYAWSKGAVIVASAGNNASSVPHFPAGDRGVMGVAATDQGDGLAGFSNSGQAVFIAAPGVEIQTIDLHGNYVAITGTSTAAAHVAGLAALMKAADGSLSNGMIAGRIARNADAAGTQEQTGNGRINMPRALADPSTESIQPAGAAPVGLGGPFVGPYVASNVRLVLDGGLDIASPPGATDKTINRSQAFVVRVIISNQNNSGDTARTWSNISANLTVPTGWTSTANLSGASLGNATVGGIAVCGAGVTTTSCTFQWTVTPPNATSQNNNITVNISGTPSGGVSCTAGGNKCTDTASVNSIVVVNPAALTITSLTAKQEGAPGTDVIVKAGQNVALTLTVANNGTVPAAGANSVAGSSVTVTPTGTASTTCGAASAAANIAAGNNRAYSYSCGSVAGNGTLAFAASASGSDENTGAALSAGPATSNIISVDSTAPTSGLSPASGSVNAPFSFSWNITDPTVGGVSSSVATATCAVTIDGGAASSACSGSLSLTSAGAHSIVVSAQDVAGNTLSDSRTYTVVADNAAPVVVLSFPAPVTGASGYYNASDAVPVVGSVTANDTTTGNSNITAISCPGATLGDITGLDSPSATAPVTVSGEGIHNITCVATDSAGNTGATGTANAKTVKIDTVVPDTDITANPSNPTKTTSATFSFTGTDPSPSSGGPTFECKLDAASFAYCTSPKTYSGLVDGPHTFEVRARDTAGNVDLTPARFMWVVDTQPPQVTVSFSPPNGSNGWFTTSPLTGSVTATDGSRVTAISCTDGGGGLTQGALVDGGTTSASRTLTVTGDGIHSISCSATDGANNTGAAAGSANTAMLKIDTTSPTVVRNLIADNCSLLGNAGWCRGTQTAGFTASDATSGVATPCSGAGCNFTQSSSVNGSAVLIASGAVCDAAGNCNSGINAGPYMIDSIPAAVAITTPASGGIYLLNQAIPSSYNCSDLTSGPSTCAGPVASGLNIDTASVGPKSFKVDATDVAGNPSTLTNAYAVQYASVGLCLGSPGHAILQPINADGTSVFQQKSTVPAKFRVCDALGNSIGTPGVVSSFRLVQKLNGLIADPVDEIVDSTTPDTAFRWDPTARQWIFNINTKGQQAGSTYVYRIDLNDGTSILFQFGLK